MGGAEPMIVVAFYFGLFALVFFVALDVAASYYERRHVERPDEDGGDQ